MLRNNSTPSFFSQHVLPVFLIFLIPAFSAWFFNLAERQTDAEVLDSLRIQIQHSPMTGEEKAAAIAFFEATPMSTVMASRSPDMLMLQADFEPTQFRYAVFRWMKRVAWIAIASILVSLLLVGCSVAFSFRSQRAQYWSLRFGWPILRTLAFLQIVAQGVLAAFLSFWVTALFLGLYSLHLIVIIGVLATGAVIPMLVTIFRKAGNQLEVEGELIPEDDAPELWRRIRNLAAQLQTRVPDQIIAGIDASFFVTEHEIRLKDQDTILRGRSLFISLPMLKIMSMEEADAVLGHELAHFSGEDTLWSRKINPLMSKFTAYLSALDVGFSKAIAHFLFMFWKLYLLSIGHLSRVREFRADSIGASVSSPDALKRALIKTAGYSQFRATTLNSFFEENRSNSEQPLSAILEQEFPASLRSFTSDARSAFREIPHPFDSHPPLNQRLAKLGFEPAQALFDPSIHEELKNTWCDIMPSATSIEQRMWSSQQELIQMHQGFIAALRLKPDGPEEEAQVQNHFPLRLFTRKDGAQASVSYHQIEVPFLAIPLPFKQIEGVSYDTTSKKLLIAYSGVDDGKSGVLEFAAHKFVNEDGDLLTFFSQYYDRHHAALEHAQRQKNLL